MLTLHSVHNLGLFYDNQEKLMDAEAIFQRALDGYEKVLGPAHESTLYSVFRLGKVYDKQERYLEAE